MAGLAFECVAGVGAFGVDCDWGVEEVVTTWEAIEAVGDTPLFIELDGNEQSGWTAWLTGEFDCVQVGTGRTKHEACVGAVEYLRKVAEAFESMGRKL